MHNMKGVSLILSVLLFTVFMSSCANDEQNPSPEDSYSTLMVKADTKSAGMKSISESVEQIILTGNDILWFNETTNEIRFKDNYYLQKSISFYTDIKFYLDDDFLFSTIKVTDINFQIYNSPVLYYNMTENKFYINDGYPEISVLKPQDKIQKARDKNMQAIANEWGKFIRYMKKVNKYKK